MTGCYNDVVQWYSELHSCISQIISLNVPADNVESELLHTYNRIDPYDTLILCVRVAVLTAVTLTVPIVLFPVSSCSLFGYCLYVLFCCLISKFSLLSTGAQSHTAHVILHKIFQLVASHCHRSYSAHFHQHAGDICSKYSGNLRHHWLVQLNISRVIEVK